LAIGATAYLNITDRRDAIKDVEKAVTSTLEAFIVFVILFVLQWLFSSSKRAFTFKIYCMPSQATTNGEVDFLKKLCDQLMLTDNFELVREPFGDSADLLVRSPSSGKSVAIEIKSAGDYGELPVSTIIPIAKLARQIDKFGKVMLIAFSSVPVLLSRKLKELDVEALTQPTVNQVVERVQLALSA
jgi:hypothetical protein